MSAAKYVLPIVASVLAAKAGARSNIGQAFQEKAGDYMIKKGVAGLRHVMNDMR